MTFLLETLRLGLSSLLLHKLRSLLTALGIIIGVGAVVAISAYGEGSKRAALADIRGLGANNILLKSVKPPETAETEGAEEAGGGGDEQEAIINAYGLTRQDLRRLNQPELGEIEHIVPLKRVGSFIDNGPLSVKAASVYGTTPLIGETLPMSLARGRHLTWQDDQRLAAVAVLGAEAADHLFRLEDPLAGTFSIDGQRFIVVGVLEPIGVTSGRDVNFDIYIPLRTAEARFGDTRELPGGTVIEKIEISDLIIRISETSMVRPVADNVRSIVEAGHADTQDVQVTVPLELIEQEERTALMFTILMVVIASLSLLVGGIGIMNIMLASVTERIREIGIRRALGATRLHISMQFLVETTVLSMVGGVLGIVLGLLVAGVLALFAPHFEAIKTPAPTAMPMVVSFVFAVFIGIVFGLYPAIRAAMQDPIVALRHD